MYWSRDEVGLTKAIMERRKEVTTGRPKMAIVEDIFGGRMGGEEDAFRDEEKGRRP